MVDPLDNLTSSEQLRRLLLQDEQDRIDRLEARLGDDDALKISLIPIIADVLRDAGVKDYRRLAGALAPIVLQSIKTEIHNSRDMMVDALYPITGRLVAAAVRNAFKDLVDQLNNKLDDSLSVDRWRAKIKAKISGRSEAEILLSEGAAFEIVDLFLINRQSGLLIAQAGPDADQGGVDSHLLSSILTAIMAFVRDAMSQSSEQDLRTLHVGDVRLHLQVSPGAILAIKTQGPPPAGFDTALSETFYAFLSRWGNVLSDPDEIESRDERALTEDLEERFQSLLKAKRSNFKGTSNKGAILLGSLALVAALWIGWTFYQRWSSDRIEAAARSLIAEQSELIGYPIEIGYRRSDDTLAISGLFPNQASIETLRSDVETALPDVTLAMNAAALPDQAPDLTGIPTKADLTDLQGVLSDQLTGTIDDRISAFSGKISSIEQRLPTPSELEHAAFRTWLDSQILRFGDDSEFDDEATANAVLEEIVERFTALPADVGLRIVGYGDDLGEERVSDRVSRSRAALVARRVVALGVSSERLELVGRGNEKRLGDVDGPGSINRRVEFELIYLFDRNSFNVAQ
ncbi:MAG: OmpA family protein [Geminicoccaceae bacterium]